MTRARARYLRRLWHALYISRDTRPAARVHAIERDRRARRYARFSATVDAALWDSSAD